MRKIKQQDTHWKKTFANHTPDREQLNKIRVITLCWNNLAPIWEREKTKTKKHYLPL